MKIGLKDRTQLGVLVFAGLILIYVSHDAGRHTEALLLSMFLVCALFVSLSFQCWLTHQAKEWAEDERKYRKAAEKELWGIINGGGDDSP